MFADRTDAGERLGAALRPLLPVAGAALAVGLARGGVVVAWAAARVLACPFAALAVRKVSDPLDPEFALGAVAAGGEVVWNQAAVPAPPLPQSALGRRAEAARRDADRLQAAYGAAWAEALAGRTAVVVDDGLATGLTALAAVRRLRALGASPVLVAAPVASPSARNLLAPEADELVFLAVPHGFQAVSPYYASFPPVDDAEVQALLADPGEEG